MRVALICLSLTACDMEAGRRAVACRHGAGPEPHAGAFLFGIAGVMIAGQSQEHRDWTERYLECVRSGNRGYAAKE